MKQPPAVISLLLAILFASSLAAQTDVSVSQKAMPDHRERITHFFDLQASVHYIYQTSISSDGTSVAWSADSSEGQIIRAVSSSRPAGLIHITASSSDSTYNEIEPQWSPDGKEIAFLSDAQTKGQLQLYIANAITGALLTQKRHTNFDGYVSHLRWSPDGNYLSILYVHKSTREPSPMAAEDRATGIIDSVANTNVQRIAVINHTTGEMREVTPEGLYIFEYDWSPDSKQVVYNAAVPPGDDNWYISKIYKQSILSYDTVLLYKPAFQVAVPRWSPDGKSIAFIEGLMSDQGGDGGEIFMMDANGSHLKNLTPNRKSTPSWLGWKKDGDILFTEFVGGSTAINLLHIKEGSVQTVSKGDEYLRAGNEEMSLSVGESKAGLTYAVIRSSWNHLPEVWKGTGGKWMQVSHLNDSIRKPFLRAENITWTSESWPVQGWLLYPQNYDSTKKYPMLVCVHGGPAWISTPTWSAPDFNTTVYPQFGYFVFFPNARGGYGQGEAFTRANQRDWGFGDLRDIIKGVDVIVNRLPVDNNRVGLLGWSYGGSIAMISVTQTNRFRASVCGAGAGDWLSYYGQNSIDKWMNSYFNVSPYDDPEPYRKVSAMTYIKKVKTPVLLMVGERDGECPPPQSFQYWHALKELGVPTQLVVYADEGHSFYKYEDMIDVSVRTLEWFEKWMPAK